MGACYDWGGLASPGKGDAVFEQDAGDPVRLHEG